MKTKYAIKGRGAGNPAPRPFIQFLGKKRDALKPVKALQPDIPPDVPSTLPQTMKSG